MASSNELITKKINFNLLYCYVTIFIVFMGPSFIKFNIFDINLNMGRILMILPLFKIIFTMIKNKSISKIITSQNKVVTYSLVFYIVWSAYSIVTIVMNRDISYYYIINFFILAGVASIIFFTDVIKSNKDFLNIFRIIEIAVIINVIEFCIMYINGQVTSQYNGFYFNTNDLATLLTLAIPIEITLILNNKSHMFLILRIILLLLILYVFIKLDSRACNIGLCLGVFAYVISLFRNIKKRKEAQYRELKIIFFIILFILSAIIIYFILKDNIGNINVIPEVDKVLGSNDIRINLIYNGIEFLKDDLNFIFGIGAGNMTYYLKNYATYDTAGIYDMHNLWLEVFVGYGVIIFIGYLIMYCKLCIELIKRLFTKQKIINSISKAFLFFLLAFIVACISSSNSITKEWIWLTFGLCIAFIKINNSDEVINKQR